MKLITNTLTLHLNNPKLERLPKRSIIQQKRSRAFKAVWEAYDSTKRP